jgi:small subunit ribosomal protein S6
MVISPDTNEEESSGLVERVGKFITDNGGVVKNQESWGTRKLAYPIENYREGSYVISEFNSEPSTANELEKLLRASQQVIRHLVIKQDEEVDEESEI